MQQPGSLMNSNVFRAILAMDSYNRGYDAQLNDVEGDAIGIAVIQTDSTDQFGLDITSSVGFYAISYSWNDQNVISYRGTNPDFSGTEEDFFNSPGAADVFNGWTVGAGFPGGGQAQLAIEFYKAVAGVSTPYYLIEPHDNATMLVGHSLGGGLAGFVGSLSGELNYGYDHMPFGLAAYAQAFSDSIQAVTADEALLADLVDILTDGNFTFNTLLENGQAIGDFFDQVMQHFNLRTPLYDFQGTSVEGEVLQHIRDGSLQVAIAGVSGSLLTMLGGGPALGTILSGLGLYLDYETAEYEQLPGMTQNQISVHGADLSIMQRHSMSLLTTLLFGEEQWYQEDNSRVAGQWEAAAKNILPALFDQEIGLGIGRLKNGVEGGTGEADPAGQMATAIAYSAINEGTLVFGDTGIRALFDDMSNLGQTFGGGSGGGGGPRSVSGTAPTSLVDAADDVGRVIVEFAGLLAVNHVTQANLGTATAGILEYHDITVSNAATLTIDFRPATWDAVDATHNIVTKGDLVQGFLNDGSLDGNLFQVVSDWYGSFAGDLLDNITSISIAQSAGAALAQLSGSGLALQILSDTQNTLEFSAESEFVVGAFSADHLTTLGGNDILIGGRGDDELFGGDGQDFLYGGGDSDQLYGGNGADTLYSGDRESGSANAMDELYGGNDDDLLIFNFGGGLAAGGAGDDIIDARTEIGGVSVQYHMGDGSDSLLWDYDFELSSLDFSNYNLLDLDARGDVRINFADISGDQIYFDWNVQTMDQLDGANDVVNKLFQGNMSIFMQDGTKIMDIGNVIGSEQTSGFFNDVSYSLMNMPQIDFADGEFSTGEANVYIGGNVADFRVIAAEPLVQNQQASGWHGSDFASFDVEQQIDRRLAVMVQNMATFGVAGREGPFLRERTFDQQFEYFA